MDLLVEQAAQAHCIEAEPALLGTDVGSQMELARRMPVDMAVQAGHTLLRFGALTVIR